MRDNPDKTPKRMFDTVPELEFEEELKKLRVKYRKQFHTSKPHFLYDFLIEEHTIVEIDGPYHYNPKLHSSVELFEKRQQIDALKNMVAGEKGYNIIRLEVGQHLPGNWRDILLIQGWNICQL